MLVDQYLAKIYSKENNVYKFVYTEEFRWLNPRKN